MPLEGGIQDGHQIDWMEDNFASRCRRKVFLVSKYMLLGLTNSFCLTTRVTYLYFKCLWWRSTKNVQFMMIQALFFNCVDARLARCARKSPWGMNAAIDNLRSLLVSSWETEVHLNRFGIAYHSNFNERCSLLASRIQVGYNVQYLCSITTRKHGIDEIVNLPSPKAVYTLQDTLWMCRSWLEIPNNPSWSGYMALATEGNKTYQQNWGSSTTTRSPYNTSIYSSWPMRH